MVNFFAFSVFSAISVRGNYLRAPLIIQFGVQANLFDSGQRQQKAALASTKAAVINKGSNNDWNQL